MKWFSNLYDQFLQWIEFGVLEIFYVNAFVWSFIMDKFWGVWISLGENDFFWTFIMDKIKGAYVIFGIWPWLESKGGYKKKAISFFMGFNNG